MHVLLYHPNRNISLISVKVAGIVDSVPNCSPEGSSYLFASLGWHVYRIGEPRTAGEDESQFRNHGAIVEPIAAQSALDVIEGRLIGIKLLAGQGGGLPPPNNATHPSVLRMIAEICPNREDKRPRPIEPNPCLAATRPIASPELVKQKGVEAVIAGMDSQDVNAR
jgi:hypothetical protein